MAEDLDNIRSNARKSHWILISVFTSAVFLSALLLFSVQLLFAKLVLPLLGGSSSVWNTAMVFFQGTLLLGYIYAHLISKYLGFKVQLGVHVLIMALGLMFLPLSIATGWTPPESATQSTWLIGLFAVSIGVPFFAISANAPLLQRWFSRTSHQDAEDPYFLYAASNAGSLLSLCAYPILLEPFLKLSEQRLIWSLGYGGLIVALCIAGIYTALHLSQAEHTTSHNTNVAEHEENIRISWQQRIVWIFLAFVPSSLMLGVTSYMTTNIASAPFLWILPLALYLLTFIIVFAKNPIVKSHRLKRLYILAIFTAFLSISILKIWIVISIVLSLIAYFIVALFCHGRLAESRPQVAKLTEFFIWLSVGGVLGGIFNALLAPVIFTNVYEYIAVLILAVLAVPSKKDVIPKDEKIILFGPAILVGVIAYAALGLFGAPFIYQVLFAGVLLALGLIWIRKDKAKSVIDIVCLVVLLAVGQQFYTKPLLSDRSFFGVLRVKLIQSEHGPVHQFIHGDIVHNYQMMDEGLNKIPLAYYAHGGTFEQALSAVRRRKETLTVSIIGLGAGAMACYEREGDDWTYFEIDPAVIKMALNTKYFTYMEACSFDKDIRVGDARLTIENLPPFSQDIIMVDAFSSDAIPTHLLTREAMSLYRSRLKSGGVIFFHTSNNMMDVSSVVVRLAEGAGLASRYIDFDGKTGDKFKDYIGPSTGVLVGELSDISELLGGQNDWGPYEASPFVKAWSDDYSSIIGPMRAKLVQGSEEKP